MVPHPGWLTVPREGGATKQAKELVQKTCQKTGSWLSPWAPRDALPRRSVIWGPKRPEDRPDRMSGRGTCVLCRLAASRSWGTGPQLRSRTPEEQCVLSPGTLRALDSRAELGHAVIFHLYLRESESQEMRPELWQTGLRWLGITPGAQRPPQTSARSGGGPAAFWDLKVLSVSPWLPFSLSLPPPPLWTPADFQTPAPSSASCLCNPPAQQPWPSISLLFWILRQVSPLKHLGMHESFHPKVASSAY